MNKNMKGFFAIAAMIFCVVILGLSNFADAATYHVRSDGNDTNCNGSANISDDAGAIPNCAFRTIQKGINSAQAGDTVVVHSGDYSTTAISTTRSGSSGNMITIKAGDEEIVTIGKIKINTNHNYIHINGFNMTNFPSYPSAMIEIYGSYCQISNNYIYSNNKKDYASAIAIKTMDSSSYTTITNNIIDGKSSCPSTVGPSIFIGVGIGGSHQTISNNVFKNMVDVERVFEIWGDYHTISNNEVYNLCTYDLQVAHVDVFQCWGAAASNILVEGNYVHDIKGQIGNLETSSNGGRWIFRNNIFANITSVIFNHLPYLEFYNNLFYRVGRDNGHPIMGAYKGAENNSVKNNAFVACGQNYNGSGSYVYQSGTADYNFAATITNGIGKLGTWEAHGIVGGSPQFFAAFDDCIGNVCSFHIGGSSVLKDKGTSISGFLVDKDGFPRAQGSAWDIGPYEYRLNVVTPSNLRIISE